MQSAFVSSPSHPSWMIQVALDASYQKKTVNAYRKILIGTLALGTLLAIVLGILIARRAMSHLRELTQTTQKITVDSLHQRLEPKNWPVELQTLAIAFNHMLERIEDSFSRMTQFSGDLAHELRTPINNLIGETEVLLTGKSSLQEYRHGMESNLEELQRITHLIENLLFLSRAENPQLDLKRELLHIEQEVAVVIEYYRSAADEKNIALTYDGHATLYANQIMFRRMISNLLTNALKYTPAHGKIHCRIQSDPEVQIVIRDNGIGIDQEHLPKIFQ